MEKIKKSDIEMPVESVSQFDLDQAQLGAALDIQTQKMKPLEQLDIHANEIKSTEEINDLREQIDSNQRVIEIVSDAKTSQHVKKIEDTDKKIQNTLNKIIHYFQQRRNKDLN